MAKVAKTNAMRILDREKISYETYTYTNEDGKIDGISVAEKVGKEVEMVYKTLVAIGTSKKLAVFVIPVAEELDMKKAAVIAGEKKIDMLAVKEIEKHTGYIRGGCSPVGMKKLYPTFIQSEAKALEKIVVSGGKIGIQIELKPVDLIETVKGSYADIVKG